MKRRDFLKKAGVGAVAASAVFGPVYAQTLPRVRWRMAAGWPRALDVTFGPQSGAQYVARRIGELTEGRFEVSAHPGGELAPTLQVLDVVRAGGVEMGHGWAGWFSGLSPVLSFDSAMPMGLNFRQQNAWMLFGGGLELFRRFYADLNLVNFVAGTLTLQMGGWFRREIRAPEDLRGLRFRTPGVGGMAYSRLGVTVQAIPVGEIFLALERGAIDAAEYVGPHDDERLGLHRAARFYYYPGWQEAGGGVTVWVNLERWRTLPKPYQDAIATACSEANERMVAEYDLKNVAAMERLVRGGTQFRRFPTSVLQAANRVSTELLEELAGRDEAFRTIYTPWRAFKGRSRRWFASNEFAYEDFVRTLRPA
jgi:TRAP-type mannitol/chloroaromatic compound transport system substrate-binding protein